MYTPHLLPPLLEFCLAIEFRHVILHRPMYHTCVIRVCVCVCMCVCVCVCMCVCVCVCHTCVMRVSYVHHTCVIRVCLSTHQTWRSRSGVSLRLSWSSSK